MISGKLNLSNARMVTPEFSVVASLIQRKSDKLFFATEAEFTTCRDCTESWKIYGEKLRVEIDQYVQVHHALVKVKGVDVLYIPYIALPIKNKRESGLLFPRFSIRSDEGVIYKQPLYWAIDSDKDLTLSPIFMSERGYGSDLEYRQVMSERSWFEFSSHFLNDSIYFPEQLNTKKSGENYFRGFAELESHGQWTHDTSHHALISGVKDLDFFADFSDETDKYLTSTDIGIDLAVSSRWDQFALSMDYAYKRNLVYTDPTGFDQKYVQTIPSLTLEFTPQILWQSDSAFFYKVTTGMEANYSHFQQDEIQKGTYKRNLGRFDAVPYLNINLMNLGGFSLKTKYSVDYQDYKFIDDEDKGFSKYANIIRTEFSFTLDKVFGLAYEVEYDEDEVDPKYLKRIRSIDESKKIKQNKNIIGNLPPIESVLEREKIKFISHSYRHSQEFKFIHHQSLDSSENGNEAFKNQLATKEGWFDSRDAIRFDLQNIESDEARKEIPVKNTFEFQWNNVLIKKSPKKQNYLQDNKYLKDNFSYQRVGYFKLSQGLLIDGETSGFYDQLTRLFIDSGYSHKTWNFRVKDYFFHQTNDHIFEVGAQKLFQSFSLLSEFNVNTFEDSSLKTLKTGIQFRPLDVLGFSALREYDLDADENISSIYQVDFMPHNNCWIFNINYKESLLEQRYAFNFEFNFGNDEFKNYRNNFFSFSRLD